MKLAVAAAAGLLCVSGAAQAQDVVFSPRIGPTLGMYQIDSTLTISDASSGEVLASGRSDDSWELSYGLQTGFSLAYWDFFGDVAIEYLKVESDAVDQRTDVLLTLGYLIGRHWSAFAGYRRGMQGDSAFNDDNFSEAGGFLGAGVGGLEAGPLLLGASFAYNLSEVDDFLPQGKFDYDGFSLKFSMSPASMPQHSLQLRYQRFTGDESNKPVDLDGDGTADVVIDNVELTESYVQATYSYAFAF